MLTAFQVEVQIVPQLFYQRRTLLPHFGEGAVYLSAKEAMNEAQDYPGAGGTGQRSDPFRLLQLRKGSLSAARRRQRQPCIQLLCVTGIYCRYFREAVLPAEKELYEEIRNQNERGEVKCDR